MKIRLLTLLISAIMIAETVIPVYAQEELIVDIVEDMEYEESVDKESVDKESVDKERADEENEDADIYCEDMEIADTEYTKGTASESYVSGNYVEVDKPDSIETMSEYDDENVLEASGSYTAIDTGKCGNNVSYVMYDTDGDGASDYRNNRALRNLSVFSA